MADTNPYRAGLSEMQTLIDRAGTIEKTIENCLRQIENRMAALHIEWKGNAASAHEYSHRRWLQAAYDMHAVLQRMQGETGRALEIYTGLVEHNTRMWPEV
jgi:WXG100 family type VII secretion target